MMVDVMPPSAATLARTLMATLRSPSPRASWTHTSRQACPLWLPCSALVALMVGVGILGLVCPDAIIAAYNGKNLFPG